MSEDARTSGGRRVLLVAVAVVVAVLVGLYIGGYFLTGDRVPSGTRVLGVDVGGLSPASAEKRLDTELADRTEAPIRFNHDGETYPVLPATDGLSLDVTETVQTAGGGRSWNPAQMIDILTGPEADVEPVVDVDRERLDAAIAQISRQVEVDAEEPSVQVTPDGELEVTQPTAGLDVDEEGAAEAVVDAYLADASRLELPVTRSPADFDQAEFATALAEVAEPAVSAPVTLQLPDGTVELLVRDYAPALNLRVEEDQLVASIDAPTLRERLDLIVARIGTEPTDATVELQNGSPVVVPDRPGVTLDADEVAEAILPVLTETGAQRSATVGTQVAQADFTTEDAGAMQITEVVSDFVTYFPHAEYRNINQGRAAELISGTVLRPGDVFSFNETVGERTRANGFVKGFVISNGVYAEDLGGGVSQVVTTTYNAAFFAGLEDVEHKPHSFYIDRYPLGREATVAWPTVDLKFGNDTPHGVLVEAWVVPSTTSSSGEMHVRMWSTEYWDIRAGVSEPYNFTEPRTRYISSDGCVPTSGYGGFDVDVYRYFRKPGLSELVEKETDHVTYTPADSVICS